jgi:tyrosine-specific transport protein
MKSKSGSVLGGILLIAGSCIGAGMLALPVITGVAGFFPAIVMLFAAWVFMTGTSLLLLEANLAIGHDLSLISIAEKTLGKTGKILCWLLFIFLFYSLSIAYISASGSILQSIVRDLFERDLPPLLGSLLFTVIFGIVIYTGTKPVDYLNRFLMIGLIMAYCVLVFLGSMHIHLSYLFVHHWQYAWGALPILVISFGFHNMIPSLAMYLEGDVKRLRITVLLGGLIPFLIYLIWEAVMLGMIPIEGREGLLMALDKGEVVTETLRAAVGKSWINTIAQAFALFAIITSFLAQSLALVDFLADGLKVSKVGVGRIVLILLTLVPPFGFAFAYPGVFITALNVAGGFAAVILFGVLPALMVWVLRYKRKIQTALLFPWGRSALVVVLMIATAIFILETAQELKLTPIPSQLEAVP